MSQYDFTKFFTTDFAKGFAGTALPFDTTALLDIQRKNMQALTEAQKQAFESLQTIAKQQSEILSQLVQDNAAIAQEIISEGTPEQKIAKQAELIKKSYEKSVSSWQGLFDLVVESGKETSDFISKRVSDSLSEVKTSVEKTKSPANSSEKKAA